MLTVNRVGTKSEFIEALRSDKYAQLTDGRMKDDTKVCAMAVFHIINNDPTINAPVGGTHILNVPVKVYNRIAELNDSGLTFNELADILDMYLSDDFQTLNY